VVRVESYSTGTRFRGVDVAVMGVRGAGTTGGRHGVTTLVTTEPRGVVGFEVILGAYSPLLIAAMSSVSLSG
jgi:hypothetical protein